jgi:predicted aldo/keto reductase-like oxidoreductase
VNFVDRHTYNFEGTVFEEARKRGLGIVAMKILGGTLKQGVNARLSDPEHYEMAVRYALGIPGLSVAIMGMCRESEVRKAAAAVRGYRPLGPAEMTQLAEKGKLMARQWGELRGPAV